jgi:hypothetical protein
MMAVLLRCTCIQTVHVYEFSIVVQITELHVVWVAIS